MKFPLDSLNNCLFKNIPENLSNGEVTLSVGESLLLVLDACEKAKVDNCILDKLNQLYLEGIKNEDDKDCVLAIKAILTSKMYLVKSDPKTINEDPTRRYFETHLAYYILQNNAEFLDHNELKQFNQNLKKRLLSLANDQDQLIKIEKTLSGQMDDNLLNKYEIEYAELINALLKNDFYELSENACKNLYEIACSTMLATFITQMDNSMPVDIYNDSIFTMGMDGRGRIIKKSNHEVRTTAKGLMKATSPLPRYHDLVNPVKEYEDKKGKRKSISPFQRSADQANFMMESRWSQRLFARQTQLYANGISSTTLAQMRCILLQKRLGNPHYSGTFQKYMTLFTALMIYNSGGHSFFEVFEVFKFPQFQELMLGEASMLESLAEDKLMYQWLCHDQKDAFKKALQATKIYMRTVLNKKMLNAEFTKKVKRVDEKDLEANPINQSVLSPLHLAILEDTALEAFDRLIENTDKNSIDIPNYNKWTALMVASQLGKTEQVKKLIRAGANIRKQAGGLSSLELAIKGEQFDIVKVLLDEGAKIKRKNAIKKSLKLRSPALYYACQQPNMQILSLILHKVNFEMADKKEAILTALKVENFEALKVLMNHIGPEEKEKYFSEKYKIQLLETAASLGSVQLIQEMIKLEIYPHQIDEASLNKAVKKEFIPVNNYLMNLFQVNKFKIEHSPNNNSSINFDKHGLKNMK